MVTFPETHGVLFKMKHLVLSLCTVSVLLLCSCAREYIPYEVLQVSKFDKVYTAYTLWYTDPMTMTNENIQQGSIIPFGTEVRITYMDDNRICFEAAGKNFQISIAEKSLENIHAFTIRTFSSKNAEALAGNSTASQFEKMRRGIIAEGMTEQQVLTAYGRPSITRSPLLSNDTWIYQVGPVKSRRVIFRKTDKEKPRTVSRIFEL